MTLAAVVALIAIAIGAFTRSGSQAGVIEKAMRALPYDRVMKLVIETPEPGAETVRLRTGQSRPVVHSVSEWFDPRSKVHRIRDAVAGVPVSDIRSSSRSPNAAFTEVALTKFVRAYRALLVSAEGRPVMRGKVDRAAVYWIRFPRNRSFQAVAISASTFKPVQIIAREGGRSRRLRVVTAQSLPSGASVPGAKRVVRPHATAPISRTRVTQRDAVAFGLTAASVLSRELTLKEGSAHVVRFADNAVSGEFVYSRGGFHGGALPQHFIRVQESTKPEPYFGWSKVTINLARNSDVAVLEHNGGIWVGYVTSHGRFFRIMTSDGRSALLEAARALAR